MKILKILFLGIVLVVLNLAYLAAQSLPDTIFVRSAPAKPGGVLTITMEVHLHSAKVGGLIATVEGLPDALKKVTGVWFKWGEGWGQVLVDNASAPALGSLTPNDKVKDKALLNAAVVGVNIDQMAQFQLISSKSGKLIDFMLQVPADMKEGQWALTPVANGNVLLPFPLTGPSFSGAPVIVADPIVIANIPDYNALQMVSSQSALSGGKGINVAIKVENRDAIASGSFKVTFPGGSLTLKRIIAGTRAGGGTFSFTLADATTQLAAAGDKIATVTFSGASIPPGGAGDLCALEFDVTAMSTGAAPITLGNVDLKDAASASLADVVAPTTPATDLTFFFGDTLSIAVKQGAHQVNVADESSGIAVIDKGQLLLPIKLKNATPASVVRFYIAEEVGKAGYLSLAEIKTTTRSTGFITTSADSGGYIQVIAYASATDKPIAAGNGTILTLVYNINVPANLLPVDVALELRGIQIIDNAGAALGVEKVNGVATIDARVASDGEGVVPGASLPKSFALAQNYPNPFNPSTTINYQIPDEVGSVSFTLNVYDIRGRLITSLARGVKGPGYYSSYWDGTDSNGRQVGSGVYFYRFTSEKYNSTRKMVLLK